MRACERVLSSKLLHHNNFLLFVGYSRKRSSDYGLAGAPGLLSSQEGRMMGHGYKEVTAASFGNDESHPHYIDQLTHHNQRVKHCSSRS